MDAPASMTNLTLSSMLPLLTTEAVLEYDLFSLRRGEKRLLTRLDCCELARLIRCDLLAGELNRAELRTRLLRWLGDFDKLLYEVNAGDRDGDSDLGDLGDLGEAIGESKSSSTAAAGIDLESGRDPTSLPRFRSK